MQGQRVPLCLVVCVVLAVTILLLNASIVSAQVTFSRDWNAGKRGVPECASVKPALGVCQMLINELRAIASCEVRSLVAQRFLDEDAPQDVYVSTHGGHR